MACKKKGYCAHCLMVIHIGVNVAYEPPITFQPP